MGKISDMNRIKFTAASVLILCGLVLGLSPILLGVEGHDGMDMGGDDDTTTSTATGELQLSYAVLPGEPQPMDTFRAVLVVTADDVPVTALSLTLTYEFINAGGEALSDGDDVGAAAMVMERLDGVYEASLALKYAGQYRMTYSFMHNDANTTHTVLQEIKHPHAMQSGTSGSLHIELHNFNELTALAGQTLEFEVEADDEAAAAAEVTVYIQDQSGLLNVVQTTLALNADGHYELVTAADFSGDAPKWDVTIDTTTYGTGVFTITLP